MSDCYKLTTSFTPKDPSGTGVWHSEAQVADIDPRGNLALARKLFQHARPFIKDDRTVIKRQVWLASPQAERCLTFNSHG